MTSPERTPDRATGADQILAVLWKRKRTFVAAFAAALLAATIVTYSLPKVYSTVAYLWVNPASEAGSDFEATQLSQVMTRTFAELIQTPQVADEVAKELPYEASGGELIDSVEAKPVADSQLLAIEAEAASPAKAQALANTYATVFKERADEFVDSNATQTRLTVASPATRPGSASRPRPKLYLLVAAVLAAFVAALAALLRERFDQRLRVDSTTTEVLGLPIIGRVPERDQSMVRSIARGEAGDDEAARTLEESFRLLLANLSFVTAGKTPATIAIVSPNEGEGKSICAFNLGRSAAELGMKVLLVDADLRRATLSARLNARGQAGLSTYLVKPGQLNELCVEVPREAFYLMPAGPVPPNPPVLLNSLSDFDEVAKEEFDLVIYDTPPLSVGADASLVAAGSEGTILIVNMKLTQRKRALHALDQLKRARANILGMVVNRVQDTADEYYYGDSSRLPADESALALRRDPPSDAVSRVSQSSRSARRSGKPGPSGR